MAAKSGEILVGPVAVNGFPARGLTRSRNHQSGEWVTAYQAEQRSRLRTVFLSQQQQERLTYHTQLTPPTNTREASGVPRRQLDKTFLMRHCFVEQPSDLSEADISGVHQNTYNSEDFTEFDNLIYINASDTALPMEAFKTFPVLEHLDLLMCSITDISLSHSDITKLQFLDLSYNSVSGEAVLALGTLPHLRELHLTGNNIVALPVEMSRPFKMNKEPSDKKSRLRMRFTSLEVLWLDDNKLTDQTIFSTLAGLRKLKYVNLDNNELYTIPQLKLIGTTSPLKSSAVSNDRGSLLYSGKQPLSSAHSSGREHVSKAQQQETSGRRKRSNDCERMSGHISNISPPVTDTVTGQQQEIDRTVNDHGVDDEASYNIENDSRKDILVRAGTKDGRGHMIIEGVSDVYADGGEVDREKMEDEGMSEVCAVDGDEDKTKEGIQMENTLREEQTPVSVTRLPPSMAPFPQLHTLSLANNLFFSSESLLACGSWPALKEMIIHNNPLVRMSNGMPHQLQVELVQKRNMNIVRHKPSRKVPFRIGKMAKQFKKVSSELPLITKQTQLALPSSLDNPLMIEYPHIPSTLSPTSHHLPTTLSPPHTITHANDDDSSPADESIFITQGRGEQDDIDKSISSESDKRGVVDYEGRRSERVEKKSQKKNILKEKYSAAKLPEHYRGYEALLEEDTIPTTHVPTDLYGCIHALRYALKHPSSSTKSVSFHNQHRKGEMVPVTTDLGTPSRETVTHRKVRELHTELNDVRTSTAILEANLADLLQLDTDGSKTTQKLKNEGKELLKQLQAKYDDIQTESPYD